MTEHRLDGDRRCARVRREIAGKVIADRRVQRQRALLGRRQGRVGDDRLAERRRVEDGAFVDRSTGSRAPDAGTDVAFQPALPQDRPGDPGNAGGGQQRRDIIDRQALLNAASTFPKAASARASISSFVRFWIGCGT